MKRFVILFLILPLSGCFDDQQRMLAHCDLLAMRIFHKRHHSVPANGDTIAVITQCMRAHGYVVDQSQPKCQAYSKTIDNAYCFAPSGAIARTIYRLETGMGNG